MHTCGLLIWCPVQAFYAYVGRGVASCIHVCLLTWCPVQAAEYTCALCMLYRPGPALTCPALACPFVECDFELLHAVIAVVIITPRID